MVPPSWCVLEGCRAVGLDRFMVPPLSTIRLHRPLGVRHGPFAETQDLVAGWMVIDVDSHERGAVEGLTTRQNRTGLPSAGEHHGPAH